MRTVGVLLAMAVVVCAATRDAIGDVTTPGDGPGEYQVKGAFIYNFLKFVEWPAGAFTDPVVVVVLGPAPLDQFEEALRGKAVRGHAIVVRPVDDVEALGECHVVYVAAEAQNQLRALLRKVAGKPVLTVSDLPNASQPEAVINFVPVDTRLGFQVNLDRASESGLQVSSKLLGLARTVRSTQGRSR